jgi:hypothetical protein
MMTNRFDSIQFDSVWKKDDRRYSFSNQKLAEKVSPVYIINLGQCDRILSEFGCDDDQNTTSIIFRRKNG